MLHLSKPITVHKSIQLVCPPAYLMEKNMKIWLSKVCRLSSELSLRIHCFCDQDTQQHIQHALESLKTNVTIKFDHTEVWKDWKLLKEKITPDDLLVVVLDRKAETMYLLSVNYTQHKLEQLFETQTKLLIYPQT